MTDPAVTIADDLLSETASQDPHSLLTPLRERDPVHWSDAHRAWLLTSYEDVNAAFSDARLSSDRVRPLLERQRHTAPSDSDRILGLMRDWMVVSDPPAHTRLRRPAAGAFRQQRIISMGDRIRALVDDILAAFVREGRQEVIAHLAYVLPATVIAEMLGAPAEDRERFRSWSDELALVAFGTGGEVRGDRHQRALRGLEEMEGYFRRLVGERRRRPADDMLSTMMLGADGDALSDDELVGMCTLLLFAGHETTTNAIANGLLALLRHPDQLERLRREPEGINVAVEELLRYDGPIKVLQRWVAEDLELRGHAIRAGERVFLILAGANHDPKVFPEPHRLDLTRRPNPHLAFGKGVHACIGAHLARIETRIAIEQIVTTLPGLRLRPGELHWKPTLASRALESLPVAYDS